MMQAMGGEQFWESKKLELSMQKEDERKREANREAREKADEVDLGTLKDGLGFVPLSHDSEEAVSAAIFEKEFRRQLKKSGLKEVTPEIYCEEISADCKLNRKSKNKSKYHQKIKELPRQNWNCLRFNWKHEKF